MSVIIPSRNHWAEIPRQLEALMRQTYSGAFEVIVVDNGSSERAPDSVTAYRDAGLALSVVRADHGRGASFARNQGAKHASGELLLYSDADDVVCDEWITAMVLAARDADLIGGRTELREVTTTHGPAYASPPPDRLRKGHGFLPFAPGSSFGIWSDTLAELGGWDERFLYSQDIELSWRAQVRGYRLGYASAALSSFTGRSRAGTLVAQQFRWGIAQALLFKVYRPAGMPRSRAIGVWLGLLKEMLPSLVSVHRSRPYLRRLARHAGRLVGSVRYKVFYA